MLVLDSVPYPRHYTFDDLRKLPEDYTHGVLCANYVVTADGQILRWFDAPLISRTALPSLFFKHESELLAWGYRLETKYSETVRQVR